MKNVSSPTILNNKLPHIEQLIKLSNSRLSFWNLFEELRAKYLRYMFRNQNYYHTFLVPATMGFINPHKGATQVTLVPSPVNIIRELGFVVPTNFIPLKFTLTCDVNQDSNLFNCHINPDLVSDENEFPQGVSDFIPQCFLNLLAKKVGKQLKERDLEHEDTAFEGCYRGSFKFTWNFHIAEATPILKQELSQIRSKIPNFRDQVMSYNDFIAKLQRNEIKEYYVDPEKQYYGNMTIMTAIDNNNVEYQVFGQHDPNTNQFLAPQYEVFN